MIKVNCKVCNKTIEVENRRTKLCPDCCREKKLQRCRNYKKKNRDAISSYNSKYKSERKEEISEYNRTYNLEHREEIQRRQTAQHRKRREEDIQFRISKGLRLEFWRYFSGKDKGRNTDMNNMVGCLAHKLKIWLEFNFDSNMSWDNYPDYWNIDHVLCIYLFDMTDDAEQKLCFNWKNTRPLNRMKNLGREKLDKRDILNHEIKLHYFEKNNKVDYDHIKYDFGYLITKLLERSSSGSS